MFNRAAYENSRPDGFGVLEVTSENILPESQESMRLFVPLQRTELKGEVIGPLGAFRLTQTFVYSREICDKTLEAVYRFPLPGDAAVTGVRVRFGKVEIRAELKEREQAETDYEEAKAQGRQAALLTRESPDVFTLNVAGLVPDEAVTVETSTVQLARAEGAGYSLRVPLTTSPRYVRSDERDTRNAEGKPLFLLRDPGHRFALDVRFIGAAKVSSPTHKLEVKEQPSEAGAHRLQVQLRDGEVLPDRDCVLRWQAARETHPLLQVMLHDEQESGHVYFLALLSPPATHEAGRGIAREVTLLVDHSGSMEGAKWQAADWAVKKFLPDLHERDTFALGLFHSSTRWFDSKPQPASENKVRDAISFLEAHKDSGGTELGVALEQALRLPRDKDERARHVLIVTDAEVSDAARILRLAADEKGKTPRRRLNVLCVDAAPNSFLALELAEQGGGVAKFLTSSPSEEDITTALDEVLSDWAEPVLTDLRFEVNRPNVEAAGREVLAGKDGQAAIDLGDLPMGRAVWVAGRVPRESRGDLSFKVTTRGREVAVCGVNPERDSGARESGAIKALFGARRVLGLEYLMNAGYSETQMRESLGRLGYDPATALAPPSGKAAPLYAENARAESGTLRELLVREALEYGLASAETAFVATRTEEGRQVEASVAVGNALPSGWSDGFAFGGGGMRSRGMASYAAPSGAMPPPPSPSPAAAPMMDFMDMMPQAMSMPSAAPAKPKKSGGLGGIFKRATPAAAPAAEMEDKRDPFTGATLLFSGVPSFEDGEAVLFDSSRATDSGKLDGAGTISRLTIRFSAGAPGADALAVLSLLLFVDDLAAPRAKMRLTDVLRQGGERPLNVSRAAGQVVRLVLVDEDGGGMTLPALEVAVQL